MFLLIYVTNHHIPDNSELELLWGAKLAVLLSLCQTREGAKYVIQNNLFRAIEISGLFQTDPDLDIGMLNTRLLTPSMITFTYGNTNLCHPTDQSETLALEKLYSLLLRVTRIIGAAVLSRGAQSSATQGPARRFLSEHRMLIVHVLKKSAGIGSGVKGSQQLEENVEDLAEAFMILITATGFLEVGQDIHTVCTGYVESFYGGGGADIFTVRGGNPDSPWCNSACGRDGLVPLNAFGHEVYGMK